MTDAANLAARIRAEQQDLFVRSGGGVSLPVAGAVYWAALGLLGTQLTLYYWCLAAFVGSGLIFPLALLLQKPLGANIMARSPLGGVTGAALIGMITFWAIAIPAFLTAPQLTPLAIAVGMAVHWPAIGWTFGRVGPFAAHALARAGLCTLVWFALPDGRTTILPFVVCAIYAVTAVYILIDRKNAARAT